MSKHTPGPWRIGKTGTYGAIISDFPAPGVPGSDNIEAYGGHMVAESVSASNAPLIAAAPCLLAALKGMLDVFQEPHNETLLEVVEARAAIAKATGDES